LKGKYRGQRQKWFAALFTGDEGEIDLKPQAGHRQEFDAWRWASSYEVLSLIVAFKRPIYAEVMTAFAPLLTRREA
jgi:putative (di)nucleoside polyphosphate hydrolase